MEHIRALETRTRCTAPSSPYVGAKANSSGHKQKSDWLSTTHFFVLEEDCDKWS